MGGRGVLREPHGRRHRLQTHRDRLLRQSRERA